jgi:hypothetical protein
MFLARDWLMSSSDRRQSQERRRVHYRVGTHIHRGDLLFERYSPILVVSWRTVDWSRVPYISFALDATQLKPHPTQPGEYFYEGNLLRTGRITSHPAPWNESQTA